MMKNIKSTSPYKTIGDIAKELNLINIKTGRPQTHTLRYWESEFKQIKPSIKAGGRRYYSKNSVKIIRFVKFLLKEKGLTINGAKKILENPEIHSLDDNVNLGVYKPHLQNSKIIKDKAKKISKIISELKKLNNG